MRRIGQRNAVILHIGKIGPFAAIGQGDRLVHEALGLGDHGGTAQLVITARLGWRRVEGIGAVEGIVEAAPARIGGVEQEAGIEDRHHQLRPRHGSDLGIDILGADGEVAGFGDEVADILEEAAIGRGIVRLARALDMPRVDLGLQILAFGEQRGIARGE